MAEKYAKVVIKGSPISKSNFKLFNIQGRAILPFNSGKYHDRYALYEQEIAYFARSQNPNIVFTESLIAVLKVYYKSQKRHPDTNNITKSIFDGIEKSGLIINDAQVRRLIIEEFYDEKNPRFELELYCESSYCMSYNLIKLDEEAIEVTYSPPSNHKRALASNPTKTVLENAKDMLCCEICGKKIIEGNSLTANKGKIIICKSCVQKI